MQPNPEEQIKSLEDLTPAPLKIVAAANTELKNLSSEQIENIKEADIFIGLGHINWNRASELLGAKSIPLAIIGPKERNAPPSPWRHLHTAQTKIKGWRISGLSGSQRSGPTTSGFQLSQEEAEALLEELAPCDIFLSHAPPIGLGAAHQGSWESLGEYLANKPPLYYLYANPARTQSVELEDTLAIGVSGLCVLPPLKWF